MNTLTKIFIPNAIYLGFISLSVQVIFARLAVSFAGGNEVYLSIFYFFWLLITAIGAITLKNIKTNMPLVVGVRPRAPTGTDMLFILMSLFSLISAVVFYLMPKALHIIPGQLIPPVIYLIILLAALLPVCLINGALFSSIALSYKGNSRPGKTYAGEAIGALIAGMITAIYYFSGGRDLTLLLFIACVCLMPLLRKKSLYKIMVLTCAAVIIMLLGAGNHIESLLLKINYQPYDFQQSVSGRLIRYDSVKTGNMTSLYSGGIKLADFPDYVTGQDIIYWSRLIKPDMANIALIGAETHMVDRFVPDNIERKYIFPEKRWLKLVDPGYLPDMKHCRIKDPASFLKGNDEKFDAVILNLGHLISLSSRRLETSSFFKLCRKNIADDGILTVLAPSYDGIWRDDMRKRLSEIHTNLKDIFKKVIYIPGDNLIFIGGDNIPDEINTELLIQRYSELKIDSPYFNSSLIAARTNSFKLNQVEKQLSSESKCANDMAIGHGLSNYFSMFNISFEFKGLLKYFAVLAVIILLLILFFAGFNVNKSLSLINILYFGAISFIFELMVLYEIQLIGGYLYIALGLILSLFMAGMAAGALLEIKYYNSLKNLPKIIHKRTTLALLIFGLIMVLFSLGYDKLWVLMIIVALAGFGGGYGFAANARYFENRPGLPYGVDLAGAILSTAAGLAILSAALDINAILLFMGVTGIILIATNMRLASK